MRASGQSRSASARPDAPHRDRLAVPARFPDRTPRRSIGLSPLVRGNRYTAAGRDGDSGSIPACTGKPPLEACPPSALRVYPRVPRVPACMGKPVVSVPWTIGARVYPRVYGETHTRARGNADAGGLSPRVRGNRLGVVALEVHRGSIPACTGKPGEGVCLVPLLGVYPRVYGETAYIFADQLSLHGLSPRVRGNRVHLRRPALPPRSIPACTGKPPARSRPASAARVYPRVYGETSPGGSTPATISGLSPRVRGNLLCQ